MSTSNQNPVKKANIMFLSIKATNIDQSLKIQMILSLDKDDSSNFGKKWKKTVFLGTKNVILQ